jgi:hypothetical protein
MDLDDQDLVSGIEKVAEFSSQLSRVLLTLGQGFKALQSSCHKTEDSVIDIRESLKKTRSKLEIIALQSKGGGRREQSFASSPEQHHHHTHVTVPHTTHHIEGEWYNVYESARTELRSTQNDVVGDLLESMELMHEVNETLGLNDGDSDLMENMTIDEKVDGLERRLLAQNKLNEVIATSIQKDYITLIFHTFGTKISIVESQLQDQKKQHEELKSSLDALTLTVSRQGEYTKSLEKTIMSILTGSVAEEEELESDRPSLLTKPVPRPGLIQRLTQVESYVQSELPGTINELKEVDESTKSVVSNIKSNLEEVTAKIEEEFTDEKLASLGNHLFCFCLNSY